MIIARSPLRISLGGGGTDLPSYYENYEGFVLAAAIDKYVYVSANRPFEEKIKLKYSKVEICDSLEEVERYYSIDIYNTVYNMIYDWFAKKFDEDEENKNV